jgi:nitroreductase
MNNAVLNALAFRHACKRFDPERKVDDAAMRTILEAGRLSPSSFGMEPWRFVVLTDEVLKARLRPLCWDQQQITTASHVVVVLAAIESVRLRSGIPQQRLARRNLPPERIEAYIERYGSFLADTLADDASTFGWTARQCYIAATNMMSAAAAMGIDSCPMEGFEKEAVETLLEIDPTHWQVALIVPFGYRIDPQPTRLRLSFDEVVEWR